MLQPWYATREQVKSALDIQETARTNVQVDRAIASASRGIESFLHRKFYPWDGSRTFNGISSRRLYLDDQQLISLTSATSDGTALTVGNLFLEPVNDGPPYSYIDTDDETAAAFAYGQHELVLTGVWGFWDEHEQVGELADALDASTSDTATITWTNPALVGVGSILKVDDERLIVTERSFVDSTQDTGGSLTASAADVTVTVSASTGFFVGETIRIDSERMLIVDLGSTTTITVKRAWDGSVLATHGSSADIYGLTGIEITRAALGSTLAAHTASDVVYRYVVPPLINDLCLAEAITQIRQEQSTYADRVGVPSNEVSVGAGLNALRQQVRAAYGRKARHRAI